MMEIRGAPFLLSTAFRPEYVCAFRRALATRLFTTAVEGKHLEKKRGEGMTLIQTLRILFREECAIDVSLFFVPFPP